MSTISSTSSSTNRITGMVSGMDTDAMVESLMEAENTKLDKLYQKQQLAEWKQEAYREISNQLRAFSDTYFNYLSSDTNLLSSATLLTYSCTTGDDSAVSVTANSSAGSGTHTILVESIAKAEVYKSSSGLFKDISGSNAYDFSDVSGKSFVLNLDGTDYTISIDESITSIETLQTAIDTKVGSGKIVISDDGSGKLVFSSADDSGVSKITLSDGDESALTDLGFSSDDTLTNRFTLTDTLETVAGVLEDSFEFDENDNINLTINGVSFTFGKDTTVSEMISEINSSTDIGLTMKYNSTSGAFTFTSQTTGAGSKITLSETGSSFFEKLGISQNIAGEDAVVYIDGEKFTRSTNSITEDGITYKILKESSEEETVSVSLDTDGMYDKIVNFINDYNALIEALNDKISEDYDSDYPPLTSSEKEEMSDDQIELWETQAKTGLLENDSAIKNLLSNMRGALYQSVSGISNILPNIGISTSSTYEDKGKLEIDTDTLKEAIENNPEEVANLFSKSSTSYSGTITVSTLSSDERAVRTREEGLAWKIYDILQDNISTYRNSSGLKGILLEKAGLEGDSTESSNLLSTQITKYDDEIDEMIEKLEDKEDYYYTKFASMETYIQQMNAQLSSLQSYLG